MIVVSANRNCLSATSEMSNARRFDASRNIYLLIALLRKLFVTRNNCHDYMFLEYGNLLYEQKY